MKLSQFFTLAELTTTSTGLINTPPPQELVHLERLAYELDKLRIQVGPIRVTSGYRSLAVNKAVGGSSTSAHRTGLAADIIAIGMGRDKVWDLIIEMMASGWDVDQAIIYEDAPHIHIGFSCGAPRKELLVKTKSGRYPAWSTYTGQLKVT